MVNISLLPSEVSVAPTVIPPAPCTLKFLVVVSAVPLFAESASVILVDTVATPFSTVMFIFKSLK
jgi:hypothetical protein